MRCCPRCWVTVVSCVVAIALVVLLVRRGGPSASWAVVGLVGYVVADLALVLVGRGGFGRIIGLDPRYSSDVVHAAVVVAALALRGSPRYFGLDVDLARWRRLRLSVVVVVSVVYLVGASFATARLVPHFQNTADREYVTDLRAGLAADPNVVLGDALAPADVVLPLVGDDSRLSRVFAPLAESPAFDPRRRGSAWPMRRADSGGWCSSARFRAGRARSRTAATPCVPTRPRSTCSRRS